MPTRTGPGEEAVGAVANAPARVSTLRRLDMCTGEGPMKGDASTGCPYARKPWLC